MCRSQVKRKSSDDAWCFLVLAAKEPTRGQPLSVDCSLRLFPLSAGQKSFQFLPLLRARSPSPSRQAIVLVPPFFPQNLLSSSPEATEKWSMSQLIQAITLLAHFHSFASFVKGCGNLKKKGGEQEESSPRGKRSKRKKSLEFQ